MLIAAPPGHGLDELRRYEATTRPPFKPGRYVQYWCTVCAYGTGWFPVEHEDLAKTEAMAHWAHLLTDTINAERAEE